MANCRRPAFFYLLPWGRLEGLPLRASYRKAKAKAELEGRKEAKSNERCSA